MKSTKLSFLTVISFILLLPAPLLADQIIEIRGSAIIESEGKTAKAAQVGMPLFKGDFLSPKTGSVVRVQCQNNKIPQVRLPSGLGRICPDSVGSRFSPRGRGDEDFLAFLNQRFIYATQFLESQPRFRWNPILGIKQYKVQIAPAPGRQDPIWEGNTERNDVVYGGPTLEPGQQYRLVVYSRENNEEKAIFQLTFAILTPESSQKVQGQVSQLKKAGLSSAGLSLSIVNLYQDVAEPETAPPEGVGLVMEALPILEPLAAQESQVAHYSRLLGDLSLQVGLINQAKNAYEQVLKLTADDSDLFNQAEAKIGLAKIAAANGDLASAKINLKQAQESYTSLGDNEMVNLIEQWLSKFSSED